MADFCTSTLTIPVIEDEWLIRQPIVDCLRGAGYKLLEAGSGEEAVAFLEAEPPVDIVFTDIRLGGRLDGWDVAAAFRRKDPTVGIMYTSGRMFLPPREAGGSLFFSKPCEPDAILKSCRIFGKTRT